MSGDGAGARAPLDGAARADRVAALREKARILYEGKIVAHRSCGVAIAETFGRPPMPYVVLRKGGITGDNHCGAILAGQLVLGELLADADPTAPASPRLRDAIARYKAEVARRVETGGAASIVCNDLVARFPVFQSPERAAFCTDIAATVAEIVAEVLVDSGVGPEVTPLPER